ncbi:BlaI/MecI/CopY family transcriptional regulator [Streptomyces adustus]|uniref:BlaI/MecI/CopY family transcriptional regulator n=1 Tax=Streptomyces adustus TaxID=1609272 RepID=UPI0037106F58
MTSQSTTSLRSRYVEQAVSDLEANRRRQHELTEKIKVLKQEEALLVDILTLAERYEGLADASPLPEQAQSGPVLGHGTQARENTSPVSTGTSRRTPSRATRRTSTTQSGAKGKSRRPLLGDVLMDLLGAHTEPRQAKELRDEILEKHPDRAPTPQVVRNTIESLVAKGRVQRHKQQRSVMYTLVQPAEQDTSSTAEEAD